MSYDYTLFKAPAPGPMESWPAVPPEPLGTVEELKQRLSQSFPDVLWEELRGAWFGRWQDRAGYAEFQITPESDGSVRFIGMRRVEKEDVEKLCRHLSVVAVDPQKMELFSSLTGTWSRAR
jgi:hypothetical protein